MDCPAEKTDGFILVVVLGVVMILSLLAVSLTLTARTEFKTRVQLAHHAEAAVLADGLARLIAHRLATDRARFSPDGTVTTCRVDDHAVSYSVTDTSGLIDLNAAPSLLFEIVIAGLGATTADARRIAAAIEDFRDGDDEARGGGRESDAYYGAGLPFGAKNAPFDSVGELDQVVGITQDLFDRLRPLVTVYSRLPGVDPRLVPRDLATILVRGSVALGLAPSATAESRPDLLLPSSLAVRSQGQAFVVRVLVRRVGSVAAIREAVVEPDARVEFGFITREWDAVTDRSGLLARGEVSREQCVN